jgi:hypothetical protein
MRWVTWRASSATALVHGFFFASGGGQCAFFEYLSEMQRPADYLKTLWVTTPLLLTLYLGTAAVVYQRFGDKVGRCKLKDDTHVASAKMKRLKVTRMTVNCFLVLLSISPCITVTRMNKIAF